MPARAGLPAFARPREPAFHENRGGISDQDAIWPHGTQDPIGQADEFLVWAPLITQSGGGLHIFLPVLDRGLDAVVHRLNDGAYLALQVKGKTYLHSNEAPIAVYEKHLFTPDQLVIGTHLDGDHLGPFVLVADAATFRRKAGRMMDRGRLMLVADMPIRSRVTAGLRTWCRSRCSQNDSGPPSSSRL